MKKIIFTLSLISSVLLASNVSAQQCAGGSGAFACTPLGGPPSGGFEDPNTTPCAVQGNAYTHAIQFTMFSIFNYLGTQNVDSIQFTAIDNLPCGLCWAVNKSGKTYSANEDGCINITGTTNDAPGQYKLALSLKAWINHQTTPGLPVPASLVDQTGIRLLLRVKSSGGACVTADTSSGANNLQASINCPSGIEDISINFSSMNIIPNPMNSSGVVSFVSAKTMLYTLHISDITGKVISTKEIEAKQGTNSVSIEKNYLSAGIYFLSLNDGKNTLTQRFSVTE